MIYRLDGKLRLGEKHELFKKGNITKKADGTFDVQLAIVCSTDGDISKSKLVWSELITSDTGVKIGISDTINRPMNSEKANFTTKPLDAFKIKVNLSLDGWVREEVEFEDDMFMAFEFTGQDASDFVDGKLSLSELAIVYELEDEDEPEIPEPEIPEPDTDPEPEIPAPDITPIIDGNFFKQLVEKYKWYGVCYLAGMLTFPIISLVKLIAKIF